jgi:hypothetical protein
MEKIKEVLVFLSFFLLLTFNVSLAQFYGETTTMDEIRETLINIARNLIPVLFILGFIVLLLIVAKGGIPSLPGVGVGGGRLGLILYSTLLVLLFILPLFIPYPTILEVPENMKVSPLPPLAANFFLMLGLPKEWMYVPAIIYLFILPFAAIYTLVWAFLQMLEVFTHVSPNINRVLAFIIAFLTIPMGWFVKTVWVLFSFMGIFTVVVFTAIFLIGVFFRGFRVATKEYVKTFKTYENVWKGLQSKLNELQKRVDNMSSDDIEREVNRLAEKYGGLYPKIKDLASQVLEAEGVDNKRKIVKDFKL